MKSWLNNENRSKIFTIVPVPMLAIPATIALGGVPTGMWNAIEHAMAAGNIKYIGCKFIAID